MSLERYQSLLDAYGCAGGEAGQPVQVLIGTQRIQLQFIAGAADADAGCMLARTDVLHLPHPPSVQICRTLLQANALWSGIQNGALGLRGSQVVMLSVSRRLTALDSERLVVLLEQMAEDARRWAAFLQLPDPAYPRSIAVPGIFA